MQDQGLTVIEFAQLKEKHTLELDLLGNFINSSCLNAADALYKYQYGRDMLGHHAENEELRPLYTRLNNLYHIWVLCVQHSVVGDYTYSPIEVMRFYRQLFKDFKQQFKTIGLWDDSKHLRKTLKKALASIEWGLNWVETDTSLPELREEHANS
jgi:hypothetical protein